MMSDEQVQAREEYGQMCRIFGRAQPGYCERVLKELASHFSQRIKSGTFSRAEAEQGLLALADAKGMPPANAKAILMRAFAGTPPGHPSLQEAPQKPTAAPTEPEANDGAQQPAHEANGKAEALLQPDLDEARRLLGWLGTDTEVHTLATFDDVELPDGKKRARKDLINNCLHGTLDELASRLAALNAQGAGVFIMVSEGDGKGRSDANVVRVRAVFQDDDKGFQGSYPLGHSMVVQTSPGKFQRYWRAQNLSFEDFKAVEERLVADFGHDHRAKGLSRVLRLPGFHHMKNPDAPHLVRIMGGNESTYSRNEILAAFPPVERGKACHEGKGAAGGFPHGEGDEAGRIRDALRVIPADDREIWVQAGMALKAHLGESGRALWDEWSQGSKKFDISNSDGRWRSFNRDGIGIGTLYGLAKQHGWHDPRGGYRHTGGGKGPAEPGRGAEAEGETESRRFDEPLEIIEAEAFHNSPAPKRKWLVLDLIPACDVTLLGADGGTGKTTLAMQLAWACATGCPWLGNEITAGPAIYFSAEEPRDELHYRYERIAHHAGAPGDRLCFISHADKDAILAAPDKMGRMTPTRLFDDLERLVIARKPRLVVLDAAADVFGGSEIERSQVRSFIRLLRSLALEANCAVLLLAHPSVDGIKTGRGYSGSTHWNNAVRSRMYFTAPDSGLPDSRVLELAKANRARKGVRITLRWAAGSFVVETAPPADATPYDRIAVEAQADAVFLDLLAKFNAQKRNVSANQGPGYAPRSFEDEAESSGITKKTLAQAMSRLLSQGRIINETYGRPSRLSHRLIVGSQAEGETERETEREAERETERETGVNHA